MSWFYSSQHQVTHADHSHLANVVRMGFSVVLVLVLLLTSVSLYRLNEFNSNMEAIVAEHNKKVVLAFAMRDAILHRAISIYTMLATDDFFVRDEELLRFYSYAGSYRDKKDELVSLGVDDKEREIHEKLELAASIAQPENRRTAELLMQDTPDSIIAKAVTKGLQKQKILLDLLDELIHLQKQYTEDAVQSNKNDYQFIWLMLLSLGALVLIVGVLIARIVTRNVRIKSQELSAKNTELSLAYSKAEDATKSKSTFLANMSHEIRTPMTGVLGMLDLLRDTKLVSEQKYFIDTAYNSAEALLTVINDVLDFSKIEAGKVDFESISFDVHHLLEEVVGLYAKEIQDKGVEIISNIGNDVPEYVRSDPTRLRQILNNLVSNAMKFTHNGEIFIGLERIKNPTHLESDFLRFEIRDTGIGISSEAKKLIFDTFTQADESTTRRFGGTGLGLAISQQMVKLFDGEIGVDSVEGKGSTFWFTAHLSPSERRAECREKNRFTGLTVSVFAQSPGVRKMIMSLIEYWGCAGASSMSCKNVDKPFSLVPVVDLAILDIDELESCNITDASAVRKKLGNAKYSIGVFRISEKDAAEKVKRFQLDASISRPVRRTSLFEAFSILERNVKNADINLDNTQKNISSQSYRTTVLLVEDNAVNQQVAAAILHKQGYRVDIASDGLQAVSLFQANKYHAVLMDCQMPIMDGFESTKKIRRYENEEGLSRTLIIALTANALEEDRQACLSCGMDDFLVKPVRIRAIRDVFVKFNVEDPGEEITEASKNNYLIPDAKKSSSLSTHFDFKLLDDLESVLSIEQYAEIVRLFIDNANTRLDELHTAVEARDMDSIEFSLHSLKGSSANLGAHKLATMCELIITSVRQGSLPNNLNDSVVEIEAELKFASKYLLQKYQGGK